MVTQLDRLARTARECWQIIRELRKKGVEVHILNIGVADDSATGQLIAKGIEAFAEYEHDMMVERPADRKNSLRSRLNMR